MCSIFLKLFKKFKKWSCNYIDRIICKFYFNNSDIFYIFKLFWPKHRSYCKYDLPYIFLVLSYCFIYRPCSLVPMFFLLSVLFTQMAADQQTLEFLFYFSGSFALISFQSSSALWNTHPALLAFLFAIRHDISITYKILELDLLLIFLYFFLL